MAAAAPSSSECAVCSEAYNGTDHDPVVLHCGHTFCRSCMIQLALECPTCRQETRIPVPFDPSCLSRNFELAALVVAAPGQQPPLVPPSLLAQAQQRLEAQRRTMERAASQTPDSFDATIEAAVQQMRQAVDESGNRIRQQVRENASKIAESLHLLEQNQQALQHELEELSHQQTSPEAHILVVETVKRIQALLGVPQVEVPAISLDLTVPAEFTQALSTLGRVETVGEENPADAPKALNLPPDQVAPIRRFTHVPMGQPITRAHILQWYRGLIAMDNGTCPAPQLLALLELPDFAKDPEALRATLQTTRALAERDAKRKGRVAELLAPAVCRFLPACPASVLGDVLAVVLSLSQAPNGPTMFNPCFEPVHKLLSANPNHPLVIESLRICTQLAPVLDSSQFGACTTLCASMASNTRFLANSEALAQLLGLIKQLAQRDDYSSMAKLYSALASNIPFMTNHDAVAQLLTAMHRTAQLKQNEMTRSRHPPWVADRHSEFVAMFRDHLYPALGLLDEGHAMDNAPLVEMLLAFLQILWVTDGTLKQCLLDAGYPDQLASLQGHPVLQAHPELGKLP
ncbi:hypothetical protein PAPYR_8102 [Paratrimastix pyriformis]|uniref:RING-type domain-containing protein n=1 Tax=Paratrimastix pyriformis TaxID=342808 RepID=A0ABQ8UGT1_9EUKA|nr:hypothetical protein PAPYR_8102 [Paratrimastix pyriformis]